MKEFYSKIIEGNSVEIAVRNAWFKLGIENGYEALYFAIPVVFINALYRFFFS